ncbi:MAG TPA: ABC transporter ATP-binding protein [Acholeplasma sp.]|jgi:ABC-2 type transport system ATP-binding protein|nr:ABC transporter ATP-binding protein [Acholeplasma sp.]
MIRVRNLHKTYKNGVKAVDGLSFKVKEGEIFALLGPNGSGKSTTINILLSLLTYDEGEVLVFGSEMKPSSYDKKKDIGLVSQEVAVFNELTVYENTDYFCSLYISDKEKRKELVMKALKLVGLEDYLKFKPKKLSGGLLRRLHIACGIAHEPKLIIFDEPTVGIDPQSRNHILEGIKTLNKEGATIIYTSHYMEEVEMISDYVLIMDHGKVVAEGTKEELKDMISLGETITVSVLNITDEFLKELKGLKGILETTTNKDKLTIKIKKNTTKIKDILALLEKHKLEYDEFHSLAPTLNDVFLELTGKELRD